LQLIRERERKRKKQRERERERERDYVKVFYVIVKLINVYVAVLSNDFK